MLVSRLARRAKRSKCIAAGPEASKKYNYTTTDTRRSDDLARCGLSIHGAFNSVKFVFLASLMVIPGTQHATFITFLITMKFYDL